MRYVILVFAGVLLCNCIPHLTAGLQGAPFPTPFAKPRGEGYSSPLINLFWGALNLVVGLGILAHYPVALGANLDCLTIGAAALSLGIYLSCHFRKLRNRPIAAPPVD